MRKIAIIVGDPVQSDSMSVMEDTVADMLGKHPGARITWLQSSATTDLNADKNVTAEHVLTCIIEYEERVEIRIAIPEPAPPPVKPTRVRATGGQPAKRRKR